MSENRDPGTGRFAETLLTGRAGLEADAGYKPMPSDGRKKDRGEEVTLREAARELAEERAGSATETVREEYTDGDGNPAPRNETLTIERAADDMAESRSARAEAALQEADEAVLAELGVKIAPKKPASEASEEERPEVEAEKAAPSDDAAAHAADLEKALANPHVAEALQSQVRENEAARQQYRAAIDAATLVAQHSFIAQFPEFAHTAPDQHAQRAQIALNIARQNPARWAAIQAVISNTANLFEAQRAENRSAAERQAEAFKTFSSEEDAKFDTAAKDIPADVQQRAIAEVIAGAKAYGIEPKEFMRMFATDRTMRSAPFQRMMLEAGLYRSMMKASKAVATRIVPPVVRPGAASPPTNQTSRKLSALAAQFSAKPNLRNAAALQAAERAAKKR